jgi:MerR family redox-sensitive transcriptional activator SoxR
MAIGEVARKSGLRASAIRFYEAEGLLESQERQSGRRAFAHEAVERLKVITMARALGFTLSEIRTLLNGFSDDTPPSARWHTLAARKLPEIEALIERASAMKRLLQKGLRCDCVSVNDCIVYECDPPVTIARRRPS